MLNEPCDKFLSTAERLLYKVNGVCSRHPSELDSGELNYISGTFKMQINCYETQLLQRRNLYPSDPEVDVQYPLLQDGICSLTLLSKRLATSRDWKERKKPKNLGCQFGQYSTLYNGWWHKSSDQNWSQNSSSYLIKKRSWPTKM